MVFGTFPCSPLCHAPVQADPDSAPRFPTPRLLLPLFEGCSTNARIKMYPCFNLNAPLLQPKMHPCFNLKCTPAAATHSRHLPTNLTLGTSCNISTSRQTLENFYSFTVLQENTKIVTFCVAAHARQTLPVLERSVQCMVSGQCCGRRQIREGE